MVRPSDIVRPQRSAAEVATSVSEGTTCLLLVIPMTLGTWVLLIPSLEELEELAREASPRERCVLLRTSLELSVPFPWFALLPAPVRRTVPLPFASRGTRRAPPSWPAEPPATPRRPWFLSPPRRWELSSRAAEPSPRPAESPSTLRAPVVPIASAADGRGRPWAAEPSPTLGCGWNRLSEVLRHLR